MRRLALALALIAPLGFAGVSFAKTCKKGCPCGDTCIDCKKKCEAGQGSAKKAGNKKGQFCKTNDQCASGSCEKGHCK